MTLSWLQIEEYAQLFVKKWKARPGRERQQAQQFIRDFLAIYGITDPLGNHGEFEHKCPKGFGDDGYIDYFLPQKLIIEMKTKGKNLKEATQQVYDYVLSAFQYIDGELFNERMESAEFDASMRNTLIDSAKFDWSGISPAIFGAMFQGVMNTDERREIGAHYTSEENILKVINPLFMDDLREEFGRVKTSPSALNKFHDKIANLHFLDPACGCGNFLIMAYRELRLLELEILKFQRKSGQRLLDISGLVRVNVDQFYGIEIEEFPCEVARVAMWLMDHLMNCAVAQAFGLHFARLPLQAAAKIAYANALQIDWHSLASAPDVHFDYIMGNPPYIGYTFQKNDQRADVLKTLDDVFDDPVRPNAKIDYIACWFYYASQYMQKYPSTKTGFVSTNSITQGEQVSLVWKPLLEYFKIHIDFAYQTFVWHNEARGNAHVHCVIIGFSCSDKSQAVLFDNDNHRHDVAHINPYIIPFIDCMIETRNKPLSNVPIMNQGSHPTDGGNLLLSVQEAHDLIQAEPIIEPYIHDFIGAEEFINGHYRKCLWLKNAPPDLLRQCPLVMKRIDGVRKMRLASKRSCTNRWAKSPALFTEDRQPDCTYIFIPRVSSERRDYIPMGFMPPDVIASDAGLVIPNATLYHFGILTSSVHMIWTKTICGRLEMRYRYSANIVYNNFPWPNVDDKARARISISAQGILDARAKYPDSSLSDLYDPLTMPPDLRKAHEANDRAVMGAYGFDSRSATEMDILEGLFNLYYRLTCESD